MRHTEQDELWVETYRQDTDYITGEPIAWDREESDSCERGTPGCSIHHTRDSDCQTW